MWSTNGEPDSLDSTLSQARRLVRNAPAAEPEIERALDALAELEAGLSAAGAEERAAAARLLARGVARALATGELVANLGTARAVPGVH